MSVEIEIRHLTYDQFVEVIIRYGGTTIDLGLLNKDDAAELRQVLTDAISELEVDDD